MTRDGLTAAEVEDRVRRGLVNEVPPAPSRTVTEILRANVLTRFNALIGLLVVIVLASGSPQDALFGGVIIANSVIGIIQEVRAKRTLDQLAVLSAPAAMRGSFPMTYWTPSVRRFVTPQRKPTYSCSRPLSRESSPRC